MSIGIEAIGSSIGDVVDCRTKLARHGVTEAFISKKTGFVGNSVIPAGSRTSDMCVAAFHELEKNRDVNVHDVDYVLVCTQNGDYRLPQTSAIVQAKLGLGRACAAFDLSLGCSGYVYALSVAKSFMEANEFKLGLVFTADPYSSIINQNDKGTDLLFGDAATVTLMSERGVYALGRPVFETDGGMANALICEHGGRLAMQGRKIFEFVLRFVPPSIQRCLELNALSMDEVDHFLLHQASRYLLENLAQRLKLDPARVPFVASAYGNTVSSSIPLALQQYFEADVGSKKLLSGFGVGLSLATTIIKRIK